MGETLVVFQQALWLIVLLSAPPLIVSTVLGLLVALVQAVTQIQEATLPYVVKLVAVAVTLAMTGRWIGGELAIISIRCFDLIPVIGR
jgi:type III secretion protein S